MKGDASFRDFVLDQLREMPGLACRAMFGGHGLYVGGTFFGLLWRGTMYLRTDEASRPDFVRAGSKPFRPNRKQTLIRYYDVPSDVLENREKLAAWSLRAASIPPATRRRKARAS